jgi:hypothetical protein
MSLKKFQPAILTVDMPAEGLHAGDVGTVVEHHVGAGQGDGYSVEFFDMTGKTVAVVTVPAGHLREPTASDRPSVRVLAPASR